MEIAPIASSAPILPALEKTWSLPSGFQLLRDSWNIIRQRFWVLVSIIALPVLLVMLFSLGSDQLPRNLIIDDWSFLSIIMLLAITIPIVLFIKTWVDVAIVWAIVSPREQVSVISAYRSSINKVIQYWWVSLLLGLVTIGGILPLVIPVIIFATWFGFAPFLVVIDGLKGFSALQMSRAFVRGKVLAVLSRQIFLGVLLLILVSPFWVGWRLTFGAESVKEAIEFLAFLIFPFTTAYQLSLLKSLRERPEVQAAKEIHKPSWFLVLLVLWGILAPLLVLAVTIFSLASLYRDFAAPFI